MLAENFESMKEFANEIIRNSEQMMERVGIGCASGTSIEELCALSDALLEMDCSCKFDFERLDNGEIAVYAEIANLKLALVKLIELYPELQDKITFVS